MALTTGPGSLLSPVPSSGPRAANL
uniref:Uncharacterized protein n=1 Tax=Anguilla anguilla TaxID=7936 RepID=A0A0E9TVM5_ANGAN